jgi:hypothetical protein
MLVSDDMTLKELGIAYCGDYILITIQLAGEKNKLQVWWDIAPGYGCFRNPIRDQLSESMPKNTSMVQLTVGDAQYHNSLIAPLFLDRNEGFFTYAHDLLRPATASKGCENSSSISASVWAPTLTADGQVSLGASPVFIILREQLS